ncbi:ara4-interacting protein [Trifolium medium]|uniref:Ara4-interacting protein n=2 Tax=Trifolium medium TaxID=97028 RepID=A0A392MU27_9FABA|nr:ara4-interacting protein [Trifolium medium]
MTTPSPEAVATFMRITGAQEFVAVQKLEEYGGYLNEAVNAHFIEGNRHMYGNGVHAKNFFYPFISSYHLLMPLSEVSILLDIRG